MIEADSAKLANALDELAIAEREIYLALTTLDASELQLTRSGESVRFATDLRAEKRLDPRENFAGHNWYHSEHDGRWAGRSTASTIYLDKLSAGQYRISFTFARFIDAEFSARMKILFNGEPLELSIRGQARRKRRLLDWRAKPKLEYPIVYDANLVIPDRAGAATDILMFVFPYAKSPNGSDKRELTGRLSDVSLEPM